MHCTYLVMSKLTGSSTAFNFQVRVCSRMKLQVLSVNLVQGRNLLTFIDSSTIYWHLYYWTVCVKRDFGFHYLISVYLVIATLRQKHWTLFIFSITL